MIARTIALVAGICAATALPVLAAMAAEDAAQQIPPATACTKTINAMGASMGSTADIAPDGRPIYRFVVRTSGLDYDAVCDAATGVVSDVTPRVAH